MPHADDSAALAEHINAGASVRAIAAELNVTERTVRNRLRRAGIALPSEVKRIRVDLDAILVAYRNGTPVVRIAELHGVSSSWIAARVAERAVQATSRCSQRRGDLATSS